ncbi:glutathione S-transferase family protein [Alcaligenaceae bacterium 429]|uniref:glutathione S-transferase family protein n=1 Tax=Paenalcaligenes sp. Me52 TaxID=3392038 RepID=UPI0010920BA1|nr:glutathione S-transferase family protein [Alcaligenaceae bacterium 429]
MRLFHSPASPYVRKVMVAAWERNVQDSIEILSSAAGPVVRDQNIVAVNSSGKVPCAILPNGAPLFDSRVISQYVDSLGTPENSLYPADRRFEILTLEALGDAMLDACLLCRYETVMRPKELYWEDWFNGQMAKVDSGLDDLENKWFESLTNGGFHAGAIAAACTLGYLDFRFPDKDWRTNHPKLTQWFADVSKRTSMKETFPKG